MQYLNKNRWRAVAMLVVLFIALTAVACSRAVEPTGGAAVDETTAENGVVADDTVEDEDESGDVDLTDDAEDTAETEDEGEALGGFDANADGNLDREEFGALLMHAGVSDAGQFDDYDANDDGLLGPEEFDAFLRDHGFTDDGDLVEDQDEPGDVDVTDDQEGLPEDDSGMGIFDANADGVLTQSEFDALLAGTGLSGQFSFSDYDANDDGELSMDELDALARDLSLAAANSVNAILGFDTNADNLLTEREFDALLAGSGLSGQVSFSDYDANDDGELNLDELDALARDLSLEAAGNVRSLLTFDVNGDAVLTESEFDAVITTAGLGNQVAFSDYDANDNGELGMDELNALARDLSLTAAGNLLGILGFDLNNDRMLTQNEFSALLATTGTSGQVAFNDYDANNDGVLGMDELDALARDLGLAAAGNLFGILGFDMNRDNVLTEREFDALLTGTGLRGQVAFRDYDANNDGELGADELGALARDLSLAAAGQFGGSQP